MIQVRVRHLMISTAVLAYIAGGACGDSQPRFGADVNELESSGVETNRMQATFRARSTRAGETRVLSQLAVPSTGLILGDSPIILNGGDRLITRSIDPDTLQETERLMNAGAFGSPDTLNGASFGGGDKGQLIEIQFDRSGSGQVSAVLSSTTLPSPFELDWVEDPVAMTPAPTPFSRSSATPYFVVWDPFEAPDFEPGDQLLFAVSGKCIASYSGILDWEAGEDAIALTGVLEDFPPASNGICRVRVEMTLRRTGIVDAAFQGGSFYGEQVRVLELQSTP